MGHRHVNVNFPHLYNQSHILLPANFTLNTMSAQSMVRQSIPEFFHGKSVLVTGGTGFLGKVLIEKLLRSCSDIREIYLLTRIKKGKGPEERLRDVVDVPVSIADFLNIFEKLLQCVFAVVR